MDLPGESVLPIRRAVTDQDIYRTVAFSQRALSRLLARECTEQILQRA